MIDSRDSENDRSLYVGNLDQLATEEILYELFLQAGPVEKIIRPRDSRGHFKPFAFVVFKHPISAPYGKELLNGIYLFERSLNISYKMSNREHDRMSAPPMPTGSLPGAPMPTLPMPPNPYQSGAPFMPPAPHLLTPPPGWAPAAAPRAPVAPSYYASHTPGAYSHSNQYAHQRSSHTPSHSHRSHPYASSERNRYSSSSHDSRDSRDSRDRAYRR